MSVLSDSFLIWERHGDSVAQRVLCGKVKVKLGMRTRAFLQVFRNGAVHVIRLYGPGDKVFLFS